MAATDFDLTDFLPYLLNQAAERASADFQAIYKRRHGMTRTEWRVLFHLGRYGEMTARAICDRAHLHKTKVSRAVAALEVRRWLTRAEDPQDRRVERLSLTPAGRRVFAELCDLARRHDAALADTISAEERAVLIPVLRRLAGIEDQASRDTSPA